MQGFKQFLLRGNVVDLAVGVVIGSAFNSVVTSFTASFLTPLIALVAGKKHFTNLTFTIGNTSFTYGDFINAIISFLIIAAVVYFLVVPPINLLEKAVKSGKSPDLSTKKCQYCFMDIPVKATRCPSCTSTLKKVVLNGTYA